MIKLYFFVIKSGFEFITIFEFTFCLSQSFVCLPCCPDDYLYSLSFMDNDFLVVINHIKLVRCRLRGIDLLALLALLLRIRSSKLLSLLSSLVASCCFYSSLSPPGL